MSVSYKLPTRHLVAEPPNGRVDEKLSKKHELLLQAWECAFPRTGVIYLSGPITTGPRFLRWFEATGKRLLPNRRNYFRSRKQHVIRPNEQDLKTEAARIRASQPIPVLEPASLFISSWSQNDYHLLWSRVIERFVNRIIVLDGWEFSTGCAAEFARAQRHNIPVWTQAGVLITCRSGLSMLRTAARKLHETGIGSEHIEHVIDELQRDAGESLVPSASAGGKRHFRKDKSLDLLAETINVAQFISFSPGPKPEQQYSRVFECNPNHIFPDLNDAMRAMLARSSENSVNVRSFRPDSPESHEFIYGIKRVQDAVSAVQRITRDGLFVIVNETIDIHDGGVSGVILGDVVEFAPDDTPRCVEKPGTASLPRGWGLSILSTVYGFSPDIDVPRDCRLEFSIHPKRRGWRNSHTIGWELERIGHVDISPRLDWPNHFSRVLGDKVYGLLIADRAGLPVPRTVVINRRISPFAFGTFTPSGERWLRTSPNEQVPGKFTTSYGWMDPFRLLMQEDPDGSKIPSIIAQSSVEAVYSGAAIVDSEGRLIVEGKRGQGESLMRGSSDPEPLPDEVLERVAAVHAAATRHLGPVRFEWVFDGEMAWVVQLHRGATRTSGHILVPGEPIEWQQFDVKEGLEALRRQLDTMMSGYGLVLVGQVGVTSHMADVVRKAGIPARIEQYPDTSKTRLEQQISIGLE
jgi:hypothetical protein